MALSIGQILIPTTLRELKTVVLETADAVGLPTTTWVLGDPSERWIEIVARVVHAFVSTSVAQAFSGLFIDTATDPGDPGDVSADQTPRPGVLSALGEGQRGVPRRNQTFATGVESVRNGNTFAITLRPGDLTFSRDFAADDGSFPTYTTTADDSIYTGAGGTVILLPDVAIDLPIQADIIGTYSDATATDQITTVVTGTFGSLTANNTGPVLGSERESRDDYRARLTRATARVATGGPVTLYEYAANTAADNTPLQRWDGTGPVAITRILVDGGFTTAGVVTVYLAGLGGAVDATDVESADANITGVPRGVITNPIGVVQGVGTYSTQAATETSVIVVGSARIKAKDRAGVSDADIQAAIVAALSAYFSVFPVSGLDPVTPGAAGVMYRNDLECVVRDAFPGLYGITVSTPATATVAILWGHVATIVTTMDDWSITST